MLSKTHLKSPKIFRHQLCTNYFDNISFNLKAQIKTLFTIYLAFICMSDEWARELQSYFHNLHMPVHIQRVGMV